MTCDKRENLLVLGLFLMEVLEGNRNISINNEYVSINDYAIVYGDAISILTIETKIKNINFAIKREEEKYIKDIGNVLTFIDSDDKLITFRV